MRGSGRVGSASYALVAMTPFLTAVVVAVRAFRIPVLHQAVGVALFAAIAFAVWRLGWRSRRGRPSDLDGVATAGTLFVAPFAFMGLLWVGLGTPWEATASENVMRYLVLVAMAVAVVAGFAVVREPLERDGAPPFATLAAALALVAGPLHVAWDLFMFGLFSAKVRADEVPDVFVALNETLDALLLVAGVLTYAAGGLLALALGRARWIGRWAARAYLVTCLAALALLLHRGLVFVAPSALGAPWFAVPGFVVGIPAVPFIVPALMGAALLRRAGERAP